LELGRVPILVLMDESFRRSPRSELNKEFYAFPSLFNQTTQLLDKKKWKYII